MQANDTRQSIGMQEASLLPCRIPSGNELETLNKLEEQLSLSPTRSESQLRRYVISDWKHHFTILFFQYSCLLETGLVSTHYSIGKNFQISNEKHASDHPRELTVKLKQGRILKVPLTRDNFMGESQTEVQPHLQTRDSVRDIVPSTHREPAVTYPRCENGISHTLTGTQTCYINSQCPKVLA